MKPRSAHRAIACVLLLACDDIPYEPSDAGEAGVFEPDPECVNKGFGDACAPGKVCMNDMCITPRCGDGFAFGEEQCDDGNREPGDGCDGKCRFEVCGNGTREADEDCDDGNLVEGDGCSAACKVTRCGNGVVEAGEVCDGARVRLDASGRGDRVACSADCKQLVEEDACEKCVKAQCTSYEELPILAGCMEQPQAFEGKEGDAAFIGQCVALVDCALAHRCSFNDPIRRSTACYCGSASSDQCNSLGPANDAPCLSEWRAASRSQVNSDVLGRFSDFSYPSAWAYFLLECYDLKCSAECVSQADREAP